MSRKQLSVKRFGKLVGLFGVVAVMALVCSAGFGVTEASAAPFNCGTYGYLFQAPENPNPPGIVQQVDLATGEYSQVGETGDVVNGVGYNTLDNYFYAYDYQREQMVRIGDNFTPENVPSPAGAPRFIIGDFDEAGHYYGKAFNNPTVWEIDYAPGSPTYGQVIRKFELTEVPGLTESNDWAFVKGTLYRLGSDSSGVVHIIRVNTGTGVEEDLGGTGLNIGGEAPGGAMYADANGNLYVSQNDTGIIYRVNPATREGIKVSDGPSSKGNDGARCALAPIPTITVNKKVEGRGRSSDQFTVTLVNPKGEAATSATTSGTGTTASTTNFPASQGKTYGITDTMAAGSGSSIGEYKQSITCTNGAGNTVPTGGSTGNWTLVVAENTDYSCTVVNKAEADLEITKTVTPEPVVPGAEATFTLKATNKGPSGSGTASIKDQLPSAFTVTGKDGSCTIENGSTLVCPVVDLAPGASNEFKVSGKVASSFEGCLKNTASISGNVFDPVGGNNSTEICPKAEPKADLKITKTGSPSPAVPGEQVEFNLLVENLGPSDAKGVEVTDELPQGLTFVSGSSACKAAERKVTCTAGELVAGGKLEYKIVAKVASGFEGKIVNTAKVTSKTPDPEPKNNESTKELPTEPKADLAITKTGSPSPAVPGEQVEFNLLVKNLGPSDAKGVEVTDELPQGLTYVSGSSACKVAGQKVTCTASALVAGGKLEYEIVAKVASGFEGKIVNTAKVKSKTPDPDPKNNESTKELPTEPKADLKITKTGTPSPAVPGEQVEFNLLVENLGPSDAKGVEVTDELPQGLTFVSGSPECTAAGQLVTCTAPALVAGNKLEYKIVAKVASGFQGEIVNTAKVKSKTPDPDPKNNESSKKIPTDPKADLAIVKSVSAPVVPLGGQVTYTLAVKNNGPSDATGVVVEDPLATGLVLVSAEPSQGTCAAGGAVSCQLGGIVVGGTAQVKVVAKAEKVADAIANKAKVRGDQEDPEPKNNESEVSIKVPPGPEAQFDLQVKKTANVKKPQVGEKVTYTITVTNAGPDAAPEATLTDKMNSAIDVISVKPSVGKCSQSNPFQCQFGTIDKGKKVVVKAIVRIKQAGPQRNLAKVDGKGKDTNPRNNTAVLKQVAGGARLKLTKVVNRKVAHPGELLKYTIKLSNLGPAVASKVLVCDQMPAGLAVVSSSPKGKLVKGKLCWTVGTLTAKASKTFGVVAKALNAGGNHKKVNRVTATGPDSLEARAKATVTIRPAAPKPAPVTG